MVLNNACAKCKGLCCKHPCLSKSELKRLEGYLRRKIKVKNEKDKNGKVILYRINEGDKCPFLSDSGCVLPIEKRPIVCNIYPFLLMEGKYSVDSEGCPYSEKFNTKRQIKKAIKELNVYMESDDWVEIKGEKNVNK